MKGHGVVLVDDGDHPQVQKGPEGGLGVQVALPGGEVLGGEQDLGHVEAQGGEGLPPGGHKEGLADGSQGLLLGHVLGPREAHEGHTRRHRPRGDQNHLPPLLAQKGHLAGDLPHDVRVQPPLPGQDGAPHLHHQAFRGKPRPH